MQTMIYVGIADIKVAGQGETLVTNGLGSCLAIVFFDPLTKFSGLAHLMLPDSTISKTKNNPAKFADTAVEELGKKFTQAGVPWSRIKAYLVGGARMFTSLVLEPAMFVGQRNIEAAKKCLWQKKINLVAEDTGGNHGRSVKFCPNTGELLIKSVNYGVKKL